MTRRACPRCGLESSHDSWAERHPVAAVLLALPAGYTLAGIILAYPWFCVPLLIVPCAFLVDRRNRHRAAIAARADYEYRQAMLEAVKAAPAAPLPTPRGPVQQIRHVLTDWPTTPMPTKPIRKAVHR